MLIRLSLQQNHAIYLYLLSDGNDVVRILESQCQSVSMEKFLTKCRYTISLYMCKECHKTQLFKIDPYSLPIFTIKPIYLHLDLNEITFGVDAETFSERIYFVLNKCNVDVIAKLFGSKKNTRSLSNIEVSARKRMPLYFSFDSRLCLWFESVC